MSPKLLHLQLPAPLLPASGSVSSLAEVADLLGKYVSNPERHAREVWSGRQVKDSRTQTTITSLTLTGQTTVCPHCGKAAAEVTNGQQCLAWCSCKGELQ